MPNDFNTVWWCIDILFHFYCWWVYSSPFCAKYSKSLTLSIYMCGGRGLTLTWLHLQVTEKIAHIQETIYGKVISYIVYSQTAHVTSCNPDIPSSGTRKPNQHSLYWSGTTPSYGPCLLWVAARTATTSLFEVHTRKLVLDMFSIKIMIVPIPFFCKTTFADFLKYKHCSK